MNHIIGVVGGTGPQGRGLAYRFALAGHQVVLGSRDAERASGKADEINAKLGIPTVTGASNSDVCSDADIVLLAVPWDGHAALVTSLAAQLAGKVVVSCVNPLGFDKAGPYGLVVLEESAAHETQRLVPSAKVVGAFHHVAALSLWKTPEPLSHEDVLVCGDEVEAKVLVQELATAVTGKHRGSVLAEPVGENPGQLDPADPPGAILVLVLLRVVARAVSHQRRAIE